MEYGWQPKGIKTFSSIYLISCSDVNERENNVFSLLCSLFHYTILQYTIVSFVLSNTLFLLRRRPLNETHTSKNTGNRRNSSSKRSSDIKGKHNSYKCFIVYSFSISNSYCRRGTGLITDGGIFDQCMGLFPSTIVGNFGSYRVVPLQLVKNGLDLVMLASSPTNYYPT